MAKDEAEQKGADEAILQHEAATVCPEGRDRSVCRVAGPGEIDADDVHRSMPEEKALATNAGASTEPTAPATPPEPSTI